MFFLYHGLHRRKEEDLRWKESVTRRDQTLPQQKVEDDDADGNNDDDDDGDDDDGGSSSKSRFQMDICICIEDIYPCVCVSTYITVYH